MTNREHRGAVFERARERCIHESYEAARVVYERAGIRPDAFELDALRAIDDERLERLDAEDVDAGAKGP